MTCKLEYMPSRDKAFCLTHKRFEEFCMRADMDRMKRALIEIKKYVGDGKAWEYDAALINGMIDDALGGVKVEQGGKGA